MAECVTQSRQSVIIKYVVQLLLVAVINVLMTLWCGVQALRIVRCVRLEYGESNLI